MNTLRTLFGSLALLSLALGGCAVAPDGAPSDGEDGPVEETTAALMNNSGGLTANQCTSCGCTLQQTSGPDGNGCRTYRCVCDSTAKAKCVLGKMSFASGLTTEVSPPVTDPLPGRLQAAPIDSARLLP